MAHLNEVAEGKEARKRKRLIKKAKGERDPEPKSDGEPAKEKGNLNMAKDAKIKKHKKRKDKSKEARKQRKLESKHTREAAGNTDGNCAAPDADTVVAQGAGAVRAEDVGASSDRSSDSDAVINNAKEAPKDAGALDVPTTPTPAPAPVDAAPIATTSESAEEREHNTVEDVAPAAVAHVTVGEPVASSAAKKVKKNKKKKAAAAAESAPEHSGAAWPATQITAGKQKESGKKKSNKRPAQVEAKADAPEAALAADAPGVSTKKRGKKEKKHKEAAEDVKEVDAPEIAPVTETAAQVADEVKAAKKVKKRKATVDASTADPANAAPVASSEVTAKRDKKAKKQKSAAAEEAAGAIARDVPDAADEHAPPVTDTAAQVEEAVAAAQETVPAARPPWRRVKSEEWVGKVGSRDNTYEGTFGQDGWGYKAQQVLGQVRGKDFRHEKTKKKRGSYFGGKIDDGARHSFKYDSD